MSQNQNTSAVKTNSFTSGMVKDVSDMYIKEGLWTHARNVINNTHQGESGAIGNEPANKLITAAPYDVIGAVYAYENTWVIFSTNDQYSEIGLFNESDSTYSEVINDECLGFKRTHLISGVVKENHDCTHSVYFQDALNPDRALNLNNVPYKTTGNNLSPDPDCFVPEYTDQLDCEQILLNPNLKQPLIRVQKAQGSGQLSNGSYQAVVAYSVNGIRVTDYFTPTTPQGLWDHSGVGGSLDIIVDQMDDQFDEFELVIITVINQQMTARKVGYYSTRQKVIHLDQINQSLEVVDSRIIPIQNPIYHKSEGMFTINGYLIRNAVSTRPDFNYQPFANSIGTRWVSVNYPADYYNKGGNKVGYMRDEVYAFFIRWVYASGQKSASYHIPGRAANSTDTQVVTGADVLPTETQRWQVYDTASKNNGTGLTIDGGAITSKGNMQYWESSENYPDTQPEVWGDLCGKPIRHHKFPTSETTHIHTQGGARISVLGVEFYNIQHPKDSLGNPISDIIGYEILRGSREGNRSIVAKGLFNNMFEYSIPDSTKKGLYQNYPFNDLRPDKFLATKLFDGAANPEDNADAVTNFKKDYLTFHSPDTTFNKPYLSGNYVQVYTEEYGTVTSKFEYPYKHPKEKLITNTTLATAAIIGVGIGIVSALGTSVVGKDVDAKVLGSGVSVKASRTSGKGTAIADAINSLALMPMTTAAGVGILIAQSAFFASQGIDEVLDIIYKLVPARQYALQINSHGFYSNYVSAKAGNFRRSIATDGARYISDNLHDINTTYRVNNLYRNNTVAVQLTNELAVPTTVDNTRNRVQDLRSWSDPLKEVTSTTASYYGALKLKYDNQYGQIDSISQMPLDTAFQSSNASSTTTMTSDVLFGGDVYINRYTEKNPYYYFNDWMLDMPDNLEFDYRNYINGPYPRYWANFEKYDSTDMNLKIKLKIPPIQFDTPSDFHHLDRNGSKAGGVFSIRNAYIYLFNNGVRDFFVESELNLGYRDYGEKPEQKHYDPYGGYSDLSTLFRSDLIKNGNYYKYDNSLSASKLYNNFSSYGSVLPRDYDPAVYSSCYQYFPDRAIYSLQHQSGLKRDNWRSYLANNYKDFVHKINNIKSMNATGSIILFEDAEPVQFVGVDQLQTTGGVKITIGDGGLFNQGFQSLVNADDTIDYGSCQSTRSAVNTPFGLFWMSQQAGKIMQYGGGLEEISKNGMKFWFAEYLPSALLKQFPNYDHRDNPVMGVGCQAIYDAHYELLYFTKKDYLAIDPRVIYAPSRGGFGIVEGSENYVSVPGYTTTAPGGLDCTAPIDLVFILDITGSMGSVINNLKTSISSIAAQAITKSDNNYRLGLITVDETSDEVGGVFNLNRVNVPLNETNNLTNFQTILNGVNLGNGYGTPEPTDVAMASLLENTEVDGVFPGTFRSNAIKMVILITDAVPSGFDDMYTAGVDDVRSHNLALLAQSMGVKVYPITTGFGVGIPELLALMEDYAATTGGTDYVSASGVISTAVIDAIENVECPPVTVVVPPVLAQRPRFTPITLGDPRYFQDASWTVSYDPKLKAWLGFHDWHPDLMIPSYKNFLSIKNNEFWKHNDRTDKFANYYGQDYPWEIEFPVVTPADVTTLRSVEYTLECYNYMNNGRDAYHLLDENFNRAAIYNSEQHSGNLKLNLKGKNAPGEQLSYPVIDTDGIQVLFSKEENRYRFNQFWDVTKNRGEFTSSNVPMFITEPNGYVVNLNPEYVNYKKSPLERKKFRHYGNRIILRKLISNAVKMILKFTTTKQQHSSR